MSLRSAAFSAGRWTTASLLLRAALQFAQTMILARILTPADFGLMAIIMAVYGVVSLFIDLGLSNALIHFPDRSRPLLSSLYWLNLGGAVLMMAALMLAAWPLAHVYRQRTAAGHDAAEPGHADQCRRPAVPRHGREGPEILAVGLD